MTNRRIVWRKPGGEILVTIPASKARMAGEAEPQWLDRVAQKVVAAGGMAEAERLPDCSAEDLPDRRFRTCWRANAAGKVKIDLPLARQQRMNEIKADRNRRLDLSDKEWARLAEIGTAEQQSVLKAYRQALRDVPQNVDLSKMKTARELSSYEPHWPEYANGSEPPQNRI